MHDKEIEITPASGWTLKPRKATGTQRDYKPGLTGMSGQRHEECHREIALEQGMQIILVITDAKAEQRGNRRRPERGSANGNTSTRAARGQRLSPSMAAFGCGV